MVPLFFTTDGALPYSMPHARLEEGLEETGFLGSAQVPRKTVPASEASKEWGLELFAFYGWLQTQ